MGETRRAALEQQRLQLIAYERMKLEAGDQHGVADAAMDIRELEARLDERERMEDSGYTKDSPVLQAVLDAIAGKLDPSTQIADHPNVKFAQMQRLKLLQEGATSQVQTTAKLQAALQGDVDYWASKWTQTNVTAAPPPDLLDVAQGQIPPPDRYTSGNVTPAAPPQCQATVMGDRCVMVEGHQGAHMNADLWRAEAH
jgi:hypothetical protein